MQSSCPIDHPGPLVAATAVRVVSPTKMSEQIKSRLLAEQVEQNMSLKKQMDHMKAQLDMQQMQMQMQMMQFQSAMFNQGYKCGPS